MADKNTSVRGGRCINPFKLIKHRRNRGLRLAGEAILSKYPEFRSKYFCKSCRSRIRNCSPPVGHNYVPATDPIVPVVDSSKNLPDPPTSHHSLITPAASQNSFTHTLSQSTYVSTSEELSHFGSELGLPLVNSALRMLEESPIPKKKLKSSSWVEKKIDRTKDIMKLSLGVPVSPGTSDDKSGYREMISQLKEKFRSPSSTNDERTQILTLLPHTWSNTKVVEEFGASLYIVKKARKLFKEKGILATPNKKLGRPLSPDTKAKVRNFYEDDQVTVTLPGMKDFISMRDNDGRKIHVQKKLILCNLNELYQHFKAENPDIRIGFSSFASLRPKYCTLAGASGTHTMCVCPMHQNMKLMIAACNLQKLTKDLSVPLTKFEDCLSLLVCQAPDPLCFLSNCKNCPDRQQLTDALLNVLEENDIEDITYSQWVLKPRATLETHIKCVAEFAEEFSDRAKSLLQHHFIAKQQSSFLRSLRENLSNGECLVICDFAENYAFIAQDAAPGFHWNNDQATIYPVVIYYGNNGEVTHRSLIVISDCLNHDAVAVHVFTRIVIEFIKSEINPTPSRIIYFSDGAPQQFKNFKNFINLWHHGNDFGIPAEWHFFATAHGKGPCDGVGGTLKRLCARASLQLPANRQILTPRSLYEWACLPGTLRSISKRFADVQDYERAKESLRERFEGAKPIPNTQKLHCFIPSERGLITKIFSASDKFEAYKITK